MTLTLQQLTGSNFAYQQLPFERFLDDARRSGAREAGAVGHRAAVPHPAGERRRGAGRTPGARRRAA
ncbi:hypothetical protein [Nonomuraea dietziae]|uniref:hypothetical protein n=1 Tax=Nonomuraea dietziae TaxID=65515 RepID=UPI0031CE5AB7